MKLISIRGAALSTLAVALLLMAATTSFASPKKAPTSDIVHGNSRKNDHRAVAEGTFDHGSRVVGNTRNDADSVSSVDHTSENRSGADLLLLRDT